MLKHGLTGASDIGSALSPKLLKISLQRRRFPTGLREIRVFLEDVHCASRTADDVSNEDVGHSFNERFLGISRIPVD